MRTVGIHEARTQLSRLVEEAAQGGEIIIATPKRRLGGLAGKMKIPEDFDGPLPDDILDAFEGR